MSYLARSRSPAVLTSKGSVNACMKLAGFSTSNKVKNHWTRVVLIGNSPADSKMAASTLDMASACDDILAFQEALKSMRKLDDNIVNALNTTIPTASFAEQSKATNQCKDLYEQLLQSYNHREVAIKQCILSVSEEVKSLKDQRTTDQDNFDLLKKLRKEQTKLRVMQNELNVEEVVKDRSLKVFYERCRFFYKPADLKI